MCGNMVDIQSETAENRRGEKKKEETTAAKYNEHIYSPKYGRQKTEKIFTTDTKCNPNK